MTEYAQIISEAGVTQVDHGFLTEQFRMAIRDSDRPHLQTMVASGYFSIGVAETHEALRQALVWAIAEGDHPEGLLPALLSVLETLL